MGSQRQVRLPFHRRPLHNTVVTWQDALLADPEALADFYEWAAREIGFARNDMDNAIQGGNLHLAATAKGRKDAYMELTTTLAAVEKEGGSPNGDHRRAKTR